MADGYKGELLVAGRECPEFGRRGTCLSLLTRRVFCSEFRPGLGGELENRTYDSRVDGRWVMSLLMYSVFRNHGTCACAGVGGPLAVGFVDRWTRMRRGLREEKRLWDRELAYLQGLDSVLRANKRGIAR
jgi:hypothetical protein